MGESEKLEGQFCKVWKDGYHNSQTYSGTKFSMQRVLPAINVEALQYRFPGRT